jgi:uncharacterized membrane protein YedE/YeeE
VIETLLERFGDGTVLLMAGLVTGLLFGVAAQRSQFCLRASTVELARGQIGPRMSIWLIVFSTALASTQALIMMDVLNVSDTRQLSGAGSMSGAIIGGLMFGVGMVLARGCASRLLVLSATGNLRALVTGLLLTLVAQSALSGVLAPARETISALWLVTGPSRDLMQGLGLSRSVVLFAAIIGLIVSLGIAYLRGVRPLAALAGVGVGLAVTLGWFLTYAISQASFEIVSVSTVTFTGPATDTLMALVTERSVPLSFGIGLVPGVFHRLWVRRSARGGMEDPALRPRHADGEIFRGRRPDGVRRDAGRGLRRRFSRFGRVSNVADRMGRGRVDLGGWHGDLGPLGPRNGGPSRRRLTP